MAIVSGAGKGIGRGIALGLAEAGVHVVCAARTAADIDSVASEIESLGRRAVAVPTDVMHMDQLEGLVAATIEEFGRLDVLVNNAGGTPPRPAMHTSEAFFENALRFNVTAAFLLTKLAARQMVDTVGEGAVVNISSRSADMVQTSFVAYAAGKAALNMMTKNMAAELAPRVRVNAIGVGGVATDSLAMVLTDENLRAQFGANTPMRRPGTPEDIACATLHLASPASAWVTGKVFQVDGGTESPSISWVLALFDHRIGGHSTQFRGVENPYDAAVHAGSWFLLGLATAVAIGDWVAVQLRRAQLEYVCKPLTIVVLMAVAASLDVDNATVRQWFLVALALSLLGDVFLMLPNSMFIPGLVAFLLAHVAYIGGSWVDGVSFLAFVIGLAVAVLAIVVVGSRIIRAIRSGEHADMAVPVGAYIAVISLMLASAIGTGEWLAIGGASLFYCSDALIAWQRFVRSRAWHGVAIMVTYHAAQAGLTLSLVT